MNAPIANVNAGRDCHRDCSLRLLSEHAGESALPRARGAGRTDSETLVGERQSKKGDLSRRRLRRGTLPPQSLAAFRDHGEVRNDLASPSFQAEAGRLLNELRHAGVDANAISTQLEREGLQLFADAFDSLLETISRKSNTHQSR